MAHSAGETLSPAERAFAYWRRVKSYAKQANENEERLFGQLDTSLRDVNTGQDGAFGWAEMTIGLRLPPGLDPDSVIADLGSDNGANIRAYGAEQAFVGEKDSAISRALRGAIRQQGGTPRFVHKTGTADMNVVGPVWDCPIVAYGPGDSALDHTPDEHLDLDEYLQAITVLTFALDSLT
jgi:LysW-gamma-L-lysine carboxypeptidase